MKAHAVSLALVLSFAAGVAAQGTGSNPGGAASTQGPATAGPAASGGVIPPVPPVQEPAVAPNEARPPEAVVTPPFPPSTPGVSTKDTPTRATVGSSAPDRTLRDSVAKALADDPKLHGARINVLVSDGVVTLSGTALDDRQAARAREVAEGLAGSSRVTASIATSG